MTTAITKFDGTPSAHDPVLWRFVARVQALTPAEWGKLDALAAPIAGRTPVAGARRLRLVSALLGGPWRDLGREWWQLVADDPWLTLQAVLELLRPSNWRKMKSFEVGQRPELPPDLPPDVRAQLEAELAANDARFEDDRRASRAMWDAAKAQPLGPGAAQWALVFASLAVSSREDLAPAALVRLYAYVEPVIPYASLTGA